MRALLTGGTVDSMPIGHPSNGAIGFRFGPMTGLAGQRPSLAGAAITSLAVNCRPSVTVPTGELRSSGKGSRSMLASRNSREFNAIFLASLCSDAAGTRTGKSKALTETPSLTSALVAGTGTRTAERPRGRSISPERERQFGAVRKREKPARLRQIMTVTTPTIALQ
jgi:hypothetical protein